MFKKIAHTISVRFLSALVNLIIVVITSRYLGAEGKGWYSWWILNITFTMLLSNFIGGSTLVYFASRTKLTSLLMPSYIWGIISAFLIAFFLLSIQKLESSYLTHFIFLSILETFISIHLFIFQGKNKIKWLNWFQFSSLLLFAIPFALLAFLGQANIKAVLLSFYIAKLLTLVLTVIFLYRLIKLDTLLETLNLNRLIRFGITLQIANIAQFLNYRFCYYILKDIDPSLFYLGIFSNAIAISEGIWIISKSISAVHYAEVSNQQNQQKSVQSTLLLMRLTSVIVIAGIITLLCIPAYVYPWLLGPDFALTKTLLYWLSPGIFIFSLSGIVSHYFSGIGKNIVPMAASLLGLCCTILLGYSIIPTYTLKGAAAVHSISYTLSTLLLLVVFMKKYDIHLKQIIPTIQDFIKLKQALKNPF